MTETTDTAELTRRVHGLMVFLGSLTDSLESSVGRGAKAVCARAGRKEGMNRDVKKTESDLLEALEVVRQEMLDMGIDWPFSPYKKGTEPELITRKDGIREIQLPFRNCIVRCTLFRYGFPQGMSLCETKHGLFCGLFEKVYGSRAKLEITHAGENACLLKLKVFE
jgi:predicted hydrocarbon binding protein